MELADAVRTYAQLHASPVEQAAQSMLGVSWRALAAVPVATMVDVSGAVQKLREDKTDIQSPMTDAMR